MLPDLLFILGGLFLLWLASIAWRQPRVADRVAYWHITIPGLDESPDRIYAQVHQGLQEGIKVRQIPLGGLGFGPSTLCETRSLFAARPLYLEARYKHATLYLYVAPTPAGFFVSEWVFSRYSSWLGHPILKWFAAVYFSRQTLFQYDAVLMFTESVHAVVLGVLDRYIEAQGLKPIEEYERRPIMQGFYSGSGAYGGGSGAYGGGAGVYRGGAYGGPGPYGGSGTHGGSGAYGGAGGAVPGGPFHPTPGQPVPGQAGPGEPAQPPPPPLPAATPKQKMPL